MIDRLWDRLKGWRDKKVLKAGKEIIIKSASQAIPAFYMALFLLPPSLADELQKMLNSFMVGNSVEPRKGIQWVRWDKLCAHKLKRGMGFHNFHIFNIAMLGKVGCRLIPNPNALFSRVLKAKYYPHGDFLTPNLGYNPSYTWRSVWSAQDLINRGVRWRVEGGRGIQL